MMDELKCYFDDETWEATSDYEKKRFLSMKQNYEMMLELGFEAQVPEFMAKVNPKKRKFTAKKTVPVDPSPKQTEDQATSRKKNVDGRQILKATRLKTNEVDPNDKTSGSGHNLLDVPESNVEHPDENGNQLKIDDSMKLNSNPISVHDEGKSDDYLYCEDCDCEYIGHCPTHGPLAVEFDYDA